MSKHLQEAMAMSRTTLERGLAQAREELAHLQARQAQTERLIEQAESALRASDPETPVDEAPRTLHEALALVLREKSNRWMTVRELAVEVNERGLYRKRDGTPVEPNQIHARTKNYADVFEKDGPRVRLRTASDSWNVAIFRDDDRGFFDWLDAHSEGYFVNTERTPTPNYLVLHAPSCRHFDRSPSVHWTKEYVKVCAVDRGELEGWAEDTTGGEVTLCRSCFG